MRNLYCGIINNSFLNFLINLSGWINSIRYHGNIIFIDLRDKTGIIQLLLKKKYFSLYWLSKLNLEFYVNITGFLVFREKKYFNYFNLSGFFEIYCLNFFIFNFSKKIFFNINNNLLSDIFRLKNRFLDLRSFFMQNNLLLRYYALKYLRNFFDIEFFIDIETPFLTLSTSEGSRDFIIPYRFHYGKFFALPQSPQIFKQILMISGFDRYYQIVKCFRDEDSRLNRQPEFTQLDCEITIFDYFDIIFLFQKIIFFIFFKILNINMFFFIVNYVTSLNKFFTDKPDLRLKVDFLNISNILFVKFFKFNFFFLLIKINNGFNLFGNNFKNYNYFLNNYFINKNFFLFIFKYNNYLKFNSINFNFNKKFLFELYCLFFFDVFDFFILIWEKFFLIKKFFSIFISDICFSFFGSKNNLLNFYFYSIWIIKFPLFLFDNNVNKFKFLHNPFGILLDFDFIYLDFLPSNCCSKSYDLILNGEELGGGSVRNYKIYIQKKIFLILNFFIFNFNFFLNILSFGVPYHSGIALGLDRILLLIIGLRSIKDVIAFPKSQNNNCLLTNSPNIISSDNLISMGYNYKN